MADKELLKAAMEASLVENTDTNALHIAQPLSKRMTCKNGHCWVGAPITITFVSGDVQLTTEPLCIYCSKSYLDDILAVSVEEDK